MSSDSYPTQRAAGLRAAEQAFTNSAVGPEGDEINAEFDAPLGNGWFDSSFELRRGLEVIEWVLPGPGPGPAEPPQ